MKCIRNIAEYPSISRAPLTSHKIDTEEVLKSSFTAIYDEVQRSNLLNRRVFIGSGPEAYDGIYLGDKVRL